MKTPFRVLAFDLDGTLIDSLDDLCDAANDMRASFGMPALERERVRSFIGDGARVLVARCLQDRFDFDEDRCHLPEFKQASQAFLNAYDRVLSEKNNTQLYPQVREALTLWQTRYPLALITNKPLVFTEKILKKLNLDGVFQLVLGGDSLPEKKPSPAPIWFAAQHFGVAAADILMVGDSNNDLVAAQNAGAQAVFLAQGYGENTTNTDEFADFAAFFAEVQRKFP